MTEQASVFEKTLRHELFQTFDARTVRAMQIRRAWQVW